jgi:hypothetical protein
MLARALFIAAVLIGLYVLVRWLRRSPWGAWAGRAAAAVGIAGFLLLLTVRGGAEVALPLLVGLTPLLLRWLNAGRPPTSTADPNASGLSTSTVKTCFLNMTLDHATGAMAGQVQEGHFAGRSVQDLTLQELLALWRECQADPQSVAVLEAYLDHHAEAAWRERLRDSESAESPMASATMSCAEAYQILGLSPGATAVEIQAAYRRLMQRLHPDHGGSAYLAAQLNRARDLLLRS